MGSLHRLTTPALLAAMLAMTAALAGCGSGSDASSPRRATAARVPTLEQIRDAVVRGAGRDFALGTGIGGAAFEDCVKAGLRESLDAPTVRGLVAIHRGPYGNASAAQALNALAAPRAGKCGHRYWVPELVAAARGLRTAAAGPGPLAITYGPYMGMRCRHLPYRRCRRVGIDVVFGRPARSVLATAGRQTIRLRTPGLHTGVPRRDWVGTFTGAALPRGPEHRYVHIAVELRVSFADGRRVRAVLPNVLVSPGWG
ncbi:MAG: hypothetical protein JSU06_09600 [Actinobacteria bacterium]|nr:hypothetical protein [Actinomycetota bacterium]